MSIVAFEILFIILLVIVNGMFAMSELAVVSARKVRLQRWANQGNAKARAALELANAPNRFLSTIQIGITLVGVLAGAFGGATIAEQIGVQISRVPSLGPYGEAIGIAVVVLSITYASLIVGELVPKRLALNNPERIASFVANPMRTLSVIASPAVRLLEFSTEIVLKVLGFRPSTEPPITEEEIRVLIEQGTQAGVFEETEQDLVESVFRLGDRRISALMTPRLDIAWLNIDAPFDDIRQQIIASHYSRFPVCQGNLDNVLGVIKAKDLLAHELSERVQDLRSYLKQPLFVPESRSALQVLELFKQSYTHLALVINEYGAVEGLITTNDILEAIVGDIALASQQAETYAVQRDDGSWLLDGMLPIDELKEIFPIGQMPQEERGKYHTLAGFIMMYLGRVPSTADHFDWGGLRFEVIDMDGNRVDKVLVMPARPDSSS